MADETKESADERDPHYYDEETDDTPISDRLDPEETWGVYSWWGPK